MKAQNSTIEKYCLATYIAYSIYSIAYIANNTVPFIYRFTIPAGIDDLFFELSQVGPGFGLYACLLVLSILAVIFLLVKHRKNVFTVFILLISSVLNLIAFTNDFYRYNLTNSRYMLWSVALCLIASTVYIIRLIKQTSSENNKKTVVG